MGRMPWFPFWVDDFLSSPKVRRMDTTDIGIYILLLCEQHQSEGSLIRDTPEGLAKVFRTDPERVSSVLELCFKGGTRGGYYNTRLRSINLEQAEVSRKRSVAAKARHSANNSASAGQVHSTSSANQNHTQNHIHRETNYTSEFESLWKSYPKRDGGNSKRAAFKAYSARLREGADPADLHQGVCRYAEFVRISENGGTRYVKTTATFLGPDEHWREAWIGKTKPPEDLSHWDDPT